MKAICQQHLEGISSGRQGVIVTHIWWYWIGAIFQLCGSHSSWTWSSRASEFVASLQFQVAALCVYVHVMLVWASVRSAHCADMRSKALNGKFRNTEWSVGTTTEKEGVFVILERNRGQGGGSELCVKGSLLFTRLFSDLGTAKSGGGKHFYFSSAWLLLCIRKDYRYQWISFYWPLEPPSDSISTWPFLLICKPQVLRSHSTSGPKLPLELVASGDGFPNNTAIITAEEADDWS